MKIHVIGIAGSGKTTLARQIGTQVGAAVFDLDYVVYDRITGERTAAERQTRLLNIVSSESWVTEGAYHDQWVGEVLRAADHIVWLDVSVYRCLFRVAKRHILAELGGANPHPGWRKLLSFMNYTRNTAGQQRIETAALLESYMPKVRRCRTPSDVQALRGVVVATAY